jgi:hypothetical protein
MTTKENLSFEHLREVFVSLETFNLRLSPLEKVVYGLVTLILVGVATSLVALVLKTKV